MQGYICKYGDLHFHTHYSDNRDRATVEDMVKTGISKNLSIMGTGDHNHNLTLEKWRLLKKETEETARKYPKVMLFNNCEVTFQLGHFLVVAPEKINGTVREGYDYLYKESDKLIIINHPFPQTDEWHDRIIRQVAGIEVINGAVFTALLERGFTYSHAVEIPLIANYAQYLALNIPVAALGCSDAHVLNEMGYGVTGFWANYSSRGVAIEESIRSLQTFASTDTGIILDWSYNAADNRISWDVQWTSDGTEEDVVVELYNRDKLVSRKDKTGSVIESENGLFWISAFCGKRIVVSSPLKVGNWEDISLSAEKKAILQKSNSLEFDDRLMLYGGTADYLKASTPWNEALETEIFCLDDNPEISDRNGKEIEFSLEMQAPRVIIDRKGNYHTFQEFFIWLERNEVHEYSFININYRIEDKTLYFNAVLLPLKMIINPDIHSRWTALAGQLQQKLTENMATRVTVNIMSHCRITLPAQKAEFPLHVKDKNSGISTSLYLVTGDSLIFSRRTTKSAEIIKAGINDVKVIQVLA